MAVLDRLFKLMFAQGASDLHLSSGMPPMLRLDGEIKPIPQEEQLWDSHIVAMLQEICPEESWQEFEAENDADFAYELEGVARFRANYFRDLNGPGAVFRCIPSKILTAEQLNLPPAILKLCYLTKGLVLVTGPTGSGKSTTLCAMIDYINRNRSDHIITIEDPVEFVHPNKKCLINQREVGTHTNSFKAALKGALREDPDIILVGEMRDLETVAIAIEMAETGHLVFGTLHTTTAGSTVDRLIDQFPAGQQAQIRTMLSGSLKGVVAQTLCKKVAGGRVAALEILIVNTPVSAFIREGKTHQIPLAMQTGRKLGMVELNNALLEHVTEGRVEPLEAFMKAVNKEALMSEFRRVGIRFEPPGADLGSSEPKRSPAAAAPRHHAPRAAAGERPPQKPRGMEPAPARTMQPAPARTMQPPPARSQEPPKKKGWFG